MKVKRKKAVVKNPKKHKRYKRKPGKKHTWLKYVILSVLFLTALVVFALSSVFNIKKIEVRGSQRLKSEDIVNATNIVIGNNGFKTIGNSLKNILLLRYGRAEEEIKESQPYVKTVKVRFSIPDKVVINVVERKPYCAVPVSGANLLMDDEGYVLDKLNKMEKVNVFTVNGLRFENFNIGQVLMVEKPESIGYIKKLMDILRESDKNSSLKLADLVTTVDIGDLTNIRATLDSRITVNFSDLKEIDYRLSFLREVYFKQLKKEEKGSLEFTDDGRYQFIPKK